MPTKRCPSKEIWTACGEENYFHLGKIWAHGMKFDKLVYEKQNSNLT